MPPAFVHFKDLEMSTTSDKSNDDKGTIVHVSPSYPPGCQHEWEYIEILDEDGRINEEPSHCKKCGMSFTRYIFTECP
jgi:hypothetical protein